jgi:hypothetical protein
MKPQRQELSRREPRSEVDEFFTPGKDALGCDDAEEASDLDSFEPSYQDDSRWDAFIADDDELDPLPEYGDFWFEDD